MIKFRTLEEQIAQYRIGNTVHTERTYHIDGSPVSPQAFYSACRKGFGFTEEQVKSRTGEARENIICEVERRARITKQAYLSFSF